MQPYCVSFLALQLQDATATSLRKLLTKTNFLIGSLFPSRSTDTKRVFKSVICLSLPETVILPTNQGSHITNNLHSKT
jgi:hypothetical protein